uniref:D-isomer specific 2-hydroxyacid dehydrogenase NAD-binding domain-containing protein n=1 Tax=Eutreptiella gymnastica TaxID=73025 RepID=A0A7S1IMY2_9EUGL|mmetsp:Transcript_29525/g.53072  ORF Transcript_29525/g.53072 Transcript_29525/m.53072 type:complete len:669 (+) Transcript_29525:127-2133(+)
MGLSDLRRLHTDRQQAHQQIGGPCASTSPYRTLGVIGQQHVQAVIAKAQQRGLHVLAWDWTLTEATAAALGVERRGSLLEVVAAADIISVHVLPTADTQGLVGRAFFEAMREGGVFIDASGGAVVDEAALVWAMETKGIRAGTAVAAATTGALGHVTPHPPDSEVHCSPCSNSSGGLHNPVDEGQSPQERRPEQATRPLQVQGPTPPSVLPGRAQRALRAKSTPRSSPKAGQASGSLHQTKTDGQIVTTTPQQRPLNADADATLHCSRVLRVWDALDACRASMQARLQKRYPHLQFSALPQPVPEATQAVAPKVARPPRNVLTGPQQTGRRLPRSLPPSVDQSPRQKQTPHTTPRATPQTSGDPPRLPWYPPRPTGCPSPSTHAPDPPLAPGALPPSPANPRLTYPTDSGRGVIVVPCERTGGSPPSKTSTPQANPTLKRRKKSRRTSQNRPPLSLLHCAQKVPSPTHKSPPAEGPSGSPALRISSDLWDAMWQDDPVLTLIPSLQGHSEPAPTAAPRAPLMKPKQKVPEDWLNVLAVRSLHNAAGTIQRVWRGHWVRSRMPRVKAIAQARHYYDVYNQAAYIIQDFFHYVMQTRYGQRLLVPKPQIPQRQLQWQAPSYQLHWQPTMQPPGHWPQAVPHVVHPHQVHTLQHLAAHAAHLMGGHQSGSR